MRFCPANVVFLRGWPAFPAQVYIADPPISGTRARRYAKVTNTRRAAQNWKPMPKWTFTRRVGELMVS